MNTSLRRCARVFLLLALAGSLTGCVYYRLLAFRNQLTDFDRHVRVEDRNGLTFVFLKPVLYEGDLLFLMEAQPTMRITNQTGQTWQWTFHKVTPAVDTNHFEFTFLSTFQDKRLTEMNLPEALLKLIPKDLLLGFARSMGKASVDVKKREVSTQWGGETSAPEKKGLTRADVERMLGAPLGATERGGFSIYRYVYNLQSPSVTPSRPKQIRALCSISKTSDRLSQVEITYNDHHVRIDFK